MLRRSGTLLLVGVAGVLGVCSALSPWGCPAVLPRASPPAAFAAPGLLLLPPKGSGSAIAGCPALRRGPLPVARPGGRAGRQQQGGVRGMGMSLFGKIFISAEIQFAVVLGWLSAKMKLALLGVISLLPYLWKLLIIVLLTYTIMISFSPLINDLMWAPDEGRPPPIEGKKWEDYDKGMQKILRTYNFGDVAPTEVRGHIKEWNRQVKRRQARLTNAVQAAKKYKRALEAERRGSMRAATTQVETNLRRGKIGRFLTKLSQTLRLAPSRKALLTAAQRAKEEYYKAKADYIQEGKWSASFIRPKRYGSTTLDRQTELEKADAKNQEAELAAMYSKLKEMKDGPMTSETLDTTSQFGARGLEDLQSAEETFTRLWPKAVAPDGIHTMGDSSKDEARKISKGETARRRLRGEKLPEDIAAGSQLDKNVKTYNVFGSKRTVRTTNSGKKKRFGIPAIIVVVPTVIGTTILYYHGFTTAVSLLFALTVAFFFQTPDPLHKWWALTTVKLWDWYMAVSNLILMTGATLEASILTCIDLISAIFELGIPWLWTMFIKGLAYGGMLAAKYLPASWVATIGALILPLIPPDSALLQPYGEKQAQEKKKGRRKILRPRKDQQQPTRAQRFRLGFVVDGKVLDAFEP